MSNYSTKSVSEVSCMASLHDSMVVTNRRLGNREAGFTLMEMVIVILLLSILLAILVPYYLRYQAGAMNAAGAAFISQYNNAVASVCALGDSSTSTNLASVNKYMNKQLAAGSVKIGPMVITVTDGSGTCASPSFPTLAVQSIMAPYFTTNSPSVAQISGGGGLYTWNNGV